MLSSCCGRDDGAGLPLVPSQHQLCTFYPFAAAHLHACIHWAGTRDRLRPRRVAQDKFNNKYNLALPCGAAHATRKRRSARELSLSLLSLLCVALLLALPGQAQRVATPALGGVCVFSCVGCVVSDGTGVGDYSRQLLPIPPHTGYQPYWYGLGPWLDASSTTGAS